ncbi:MAG: DUF1800 domain-containing protein [Gemmatimonadota bacterium]
MTIPEATVPNSTEDPNVDADGAGDDFAEPTAEVEAPRSRRALFAAGAAVLAASMAPRSARAQGLKKPKPVTGTPNIPNEMPVAPVEWASDTMRLLRRITYGVTDADVAAVKKYGYRGYLERQLDYTNIDDSATQAFIAAKYPLLTQTNTELFAANAATVEQQLQQATLYRAAFSNRQLYERMVEFWSDHFNISIDKVGYLKATDDRDVIRKYALTTFPKLLMASAKSGAMMSYLDQNASRVGSPNQNYAREIMELHTLGVDGGYTQNDVAELSRVLTGWTIAGRGDFSFNANIHDWTTKTVMTLKIPAGAPSQGSAGILEGEQVIAYLLAHENTATFISTKMLRWFLSYDPTDAQVADVVAVYKSTGGDIKAMIRTILNSAWLRAAPMKFKRPFHLIASALRTTTPTVTNVAGVNNQLLTTGQQLFNWDTPDGYPDKVEYWAGNLMTRWNFAAYYTALAAGETIFDVNAFMKGNTADTTIAEIDKRLFASEIDPALRTSLTTYLKAQTYSAARVRETLALAMSANSFQWY